MKKAKILLFLALALCFVLCLASCGGGDGTGGAQRTLVITAEKTEAKVGESVRIEDTPNFSPFYFKDITYEIVGENTCEATIEHVKKNNYYHTYVTAQKEGTVSIRYTHQSDGITVVSNTVTIMFKANTISSAEELFDIQNTSDYYVLANDIDLSDSVQYGISGFSGTLDGNGHKIIGFNVRVTNSDTVGIFSTLEGTVKNVIFEDCNVTAVGMSEKIGIVAGVNNGTIENVTVKGNVNAKYFTYVGGIVGFNQKGTIKNCTNEATVVGENMVGGIAGCFNVSGNDSLTACTNTGSVEGKEQVGGLAGIITTNSVTGTHTQTSLVNSGSITGETKVGGIAGEACGAYIHAGTGYVYNYLCISVAENSGTITADGDYVGGIVGYATHFPSLTLAKNTAETISGADYVGGIIGYGDKTDVLVADTPNTTTVTGHTFVGGFAGYAGKIENAVNNGTVTATSIHDEKTYLGGVAGYCTGVVNCSNTVAVESTGGGKYVGGVVGYLNLDGVDNCKDISNTAAVIGDDYTGGAFGAFVTTDKGGAYALTEIVNTGSVSGGAYVGGITGYAYGSTYLDGITRRRNTIEATLLENKGAVVASGDYAGGLIGYGERVTFINTSTNSADITGASYVGGYVGKSQDTDIYAMGAVNTNTITGMAYVGSFAGYTGTVREAINEGRVISNGFITVDGKELLYLGGIVGCCRGIIDCKNTSDITFTNGGSYMGGIAAYVEAGSVESVNNNENTGNISGASYVGGIVGCFISNKEYETHYIKNCTNGGNVTADWAAGGIAGAADGRKYSNSVQSVNNNTEITYCSNTGVISGAFYAGGIVGLAGEYFETTLFDTNSDTSSNAMGSPV